DVLGRFRGDAVAGEGEVTGRQDAALGVLNVHVGDVGQVADVAAHHHEALVLDRARRAAVADAHVALAAVGAERHEDDPRAFVDQAAGQLGEFAVVADQHADRAAVGLDHVKRVAALDVPPVRLVRRGVDLLLLVDRAVAQADVSDVVDVAVVHTRRVRAADDVDVELERHLRERGADARGEPAQRFDGFDRRKLLLLGAEQHQGEEFGEQDEVGAVVGSHVDEVLDLADELVEALYRARLQLAGGDANAFHAAGDAELSALVLVDERVAPDQVHAVAARTTVFGQIAAEQPDRLKPVGELKAQDRIVDAAGDDLFDVVLRPSDTAHKARVVRHAPAEDDAFALQRFGKRAALLVEAAADAGAAHLGIDAHLVAVEPVAVRIVARTVAVAGDLVPAVRPQRLV